MTTREEFIQDIVKRLLREGDSELLEDAAETIIELNDDVEHAYELLETATKNVSILMKHNTDLQAKIHVLEVKLAWKVDPPNP